MNEIIKIEKSILGGEEVKTVNARVLHSFLESGDRFDQWIRRKVEKYRFVDGSDFCTVLCKTGGRPTTEFLLSIDMAKEISMVENTNKGHEARQYFINCEKKAKQATTQMILPKDFPGALRLLADQTEKNEKLRIEMEQNKHKVEFHDAVRLCPSTMEIGRFAKVLGTGRNRMYAWLRDNKYLMNSNLPYQPYVDNGYFRVIERMITIKNEDVLKSTTLITGKGQVAIQKKWNQKDAA